MEEDILIPLETILKTSQIILTDGCITGECDWYQTIYPSRTFYEMDLKSLEFVLKGFKFMNDWFSKPNVSTVEKVVEELVNFRDILSEKLLVLNEIEKNITSSSRHRKKTRQLAKKIETNGFTHKKLFEEICFEYHKISKLASKSVIKPENHEQYEALYKIVVLIGDKTNAKINFSGRYNTINYTNKEDLRADEQLVATALYLSIFRDRECSILSGDSDINRLMCRTINCLLNPEILNNEYFLNRIKRNTIRTYFIDKESKTYLLSNTFRLNEFSQAKLSCLLKEEKEALFKEINKIVDIINYESSAHTI